MSKSKKLLTVLVSGILAVSLCACTNSQASSAESSQSVSSSPASSESSAEESSKASSSEASSSKASSAPSSEPSSEASSESSSQAAGASDVSDNLFDNQFSINGTVFTLPVNMSDFEAIGFSFDESKLDYTLNPNTTTGGSLKDANDSRISISIYNIGTEAVTYREAKIDDVYFIQRSMDGFDVRIAKGIGFGSTYDEVIAAFGEPQNVSNNEDGTVSYIKYQDPNVSHNNYSIYFKDGAVSEIYIMSDEI